MQERTWNVGEHTLRVLAGDLTALRVDVIVNAANEHLRHGGGLAAAIVRAGGAVVQQESDEWVRTRGPLESGIAAVTTAGAMPARWVVHVAGPRYRDGQDNRALLAAAVDAALHAAANLDARSIAIPIISAGIFGYPRPEAAAVIAERCVHWLRNRPGTLVAITLTGFDEASAGDLTTGVEAAL